MRFVAQVKPQSAPAGEGLPARGAGRLFSGVNAHVGSEVSLSPEPLATLQAGQWVVVRVDPQVRFQRREGAEDLLALRACVRSCVYEHVLLQNVSRSKTHRTLGASERSFASVDHHVEPEAA